MESGKLQILESNSCACRPSTNTSSCLVTIRFKTKLCKTGKSLSLKYYILKSYIYMRVKKTYIHRVNHKSVRVFRLLRYSSPDGQAEGEHFNRGRHSKFLSYLTGVRYVHPWWREGYKTCNQVPTCVAGTWLQDWHLPLHREVLVWSQYSSQAVPYPVRNLKFCCHTQSTQLLDLMLS